MTAPQETAELGAPLRARATRTASRSWPRLTHAGGYRSTPAPSFGSRSAAPVLAGEEAGRFEVSSEVSSARQQLTAGVDALLDVDLDALPDEVVRRLLRDAQRQLDRLAAFRAAATGVLQSRLVRAAGPGREQRGVRDTREFLTNELHLTPSEAKRTEQTGARLRDAPATTASFRDGQLGAEHAKVITDTLRQLHGEARDEVERRLVAAAAGQDPVALGRTARRLLAEFDHDAAVADERRRHRRRSASLAQTVDGGVAIRALLYGVAAERAVTAWQAFQTPDVKGDPARSPEQRAADALEEIFDAALRSGRAPAKHGVRPQVEIVVQYTDLAREAGVAELGFIGPVTIAEVRRLLLDSNLCRVVVGPDSAVLEIGRQRRGVPVALWTGLKLRDKGCAWPGCSAPPSWCEVAHAYTPFWAGGRISLDTAVLLCKRHHRLFDASDWTVRIDGPTVSFIPPP